MRDGGAEDYDRTGAGDQGLMFGFACDETPELMPLPISLAHKLAMRLTRVRREGILPYLRPDGKTQVTVEYDGLTPCRVEAVVVSSQHSEDVSLDTIRADVIEQVIRPIIPAGLMDEQTKIFVNPTGRFVVGGPQGDSGLTGRKIIVDTYGGYAPHGGGAFSWKGSHQGGSVRHLYGPLCGQKRGGRPGWRSAARYSWPMPLGWPVPYPSWWIPLAPAWCRMKNWAAAVEKVFDFRPAAIIDQLDLRRPIYRPLAAYGHVGREDLDVVWEKTDRVQALRATLGR